MKKVIYLVLLSSSLYGGTTCAQSWERKNAFEDRLALGLAIHQNFIASAFGISGHAKWLFPAMYSTSGRFLITGKLTHTPDSIGGFFSAFDAGKYANISAVHVMGGYRYHFYDSYEFISSTESGNDGFFMEGNAGLSYVGHRRVFGVALNPVVGFSSEFGLEFTVGYQGTLPVQPGPDKPGLHLAELGFTYRF